MYHPMVQRATNRGGQYRDSINTEGPLAQRAVIDNIDAQGKPVKAVFIVGYDGKAYPVTGVPAYDMSSYRIVDPRRMEYTRTKAGRVIQTGTRVLSADGRTSTFTTTGVDANGRPINTVLVFERQ